LAAFGAAAWVKLSLVGAEGGHQAQWLGGGHLWPCRPIDLARAQIEGHVIAAQTTMSMDW